MRDQASGRVIGRIVATVPVFSYEVHSLQRKQTCNSDSSLRVFNCNQSELLKHESRR